MLNGITATVGAYILWGIFPLYMKLASHIPTVEVLAYRIIWAVPTAFLILFCFGLTKDFFVQIQNKKNLVNGSITATIITINWSTYIWAILHNHALEAALGYYIAPLFSILLGVVFLKEKLSNWQWFAVILEVAAVIILVVETGHLPLIAIVISITFSLYGFFRKSMPIGPIQGFTLEAFLLLIPAILIAVYYIFHRGYFYYDCFCYDNLLLMGFGPFTAIPLILFSIGAKYLNLATLGLMQYLSPTFLFFIAVFFFKEPFTFAQLGAFSLIWAALIIYSIAAFYKKDKSMEA